MCVSVFAPKQAICIRYGSESVWLHKYFGCVELAVDLLIANKDEAPIESLVCIVPQRLFEFDGSIRKEPIAFADLTHDLRSPESDFSGEKSYHIDEKTNGTIVRLSIADPKAADDELHYVGEFYSGNKMEPFSDSSAERVIMNNRSTCSVQVKLFKPMAPGASRWFRWHFRALSGPSRMRTKRSFIKALSRNSVCFTYQVNGPARVRKGARNNFTAFRRELDLRIKYSPEKYSPEATRNLYDALQTLEEQLITNGTHHDLTSVEINDWRTRFFEYPMMPFTERHIDGAVRVVGDQPNFEKRKDNGGDNSEYYEWASGKAQLPRIAEYEEHGDFGVRFTTKYVPWIYRHGTLLGILGFLMGAVRLGLSIFGNGEESQ